MRETVLVVTDDVPGRDVWTAWLERAGYDTETCEGPSATRDCPRLHGVRCTLRERAEAAVVDLTVEDEANVCTTDPDDGGTVYIRRDIASGTDRVRLVGAVEDAICHVRSFGEPPNRGSGGSSSRSRLNRRRSIS
jgi:hypothetical protein